METEQYGNRDTKIAVLGVVAAIAITATMDATGLSAFSALPLFPLIAFFWAWQRFSRQEIGLTIGKPRPYYLALFHIAAVLGLLAGLAWLKGAVDVSETNWQTAGLNLLAAFVIGPLMVMITEEGFFRGWLWASLRRAGRSQAWVLIWTTLAFTLWHVSVITFETGFNVPPHQIPVYLANVVLIGAIWGLLRWVSGSIIVVSVAHAIWNGLAYTLFGFGKKAGALGIQPTDWYGPEVGVLGMLLNLVFLAGLGIWCWRRSALFAKDAD